MAIDKLTTASLSDDSVTSIKIAPGAIEVSDIPDGEITMAKLSQVNLDIAPEILEIQVAAPAAGQATAWLWTWEQSTLPYARRTITNSNELSVPLYKQGTYVVNNFAAYDLFDQMTQTHSLYLKWIDGAGTDNLVSWATSTGPVSDSHPDINSGTATDVQRINISVPASITLPTLTAPTVSYTVTNNGSGAYTFSGSAKGDNPNIGPFYRGGTYTFNITATGHPFYLTTDNGTNFSAGTYFGEYTDGVTGSRNDTGTVTIVVPSDAPDTLYYQCGNHSAMRGAITIKDLAVETNNNGNYVVYFQHTQEGHKTPVELRPIPSLVNQMCLVYDATSGKFVPQDLATYVENTPSFENKIREVAGTAELVVEDGSAVVAKVNVYPDSTYLPLTGNNSGDQAFATDINKLFIWDGSAWQQAGSASTDELTEGSSNLYYTDARVSSYLTANDYDTATNIVASITDSAPATLDTLNELAAALGDDADFATNVTNSIALKAPIASPVFTGNVGINTNPLHMLHLHSTGDTGIMIQADSDNSGENDNPYLAFAQDGGTAAIPQFKIGMLGDPGQEFTNSIANAAFIHASNAGSQPLQLAHNGSAVMTLYSSGVGIGTNAPETTLSVSTSGANGIQINTDTVTTTNSGRLFFDAASTSWSIMNEAGQLRFSTGGAAGSSTGTGQVFIASDGDFGIGTNVPSYKLHVKTGADNVARFEHTARRGIVVGSTDGSGTYIVLDGASDGDASGGDYSYIEHAASGNMEFNVGNTTHGVGKHMSITPDGNVGIGTDSPDSLFHIKGPGGAIQTEADAILQIEATTAGNVAEIFFRATDINSGGRGASIGFDGMSGSDNQLYLANGGNKVLTVPSNGNVGIGTDNPDGPLHIKSGSNVTLKLDATLANGTGSFTSMSFARNGTNKWRFFQYGDDSRLAVINDQAGNYEQISLASNGSVGIGTSNPVARTHIHGSGDLLRLTSTNSGAGGAQLDLIHQSPSPADGDINGLINMGGYYSGTSSAYATAMRSIWTNAGGRQGRLEFYTRNAGDFEPKLTIEHDGDIYQGRLPNWEPITTSGGTMPILKYYSANAFDITTSGNAYQGVRTNSAKYKYVKIEADIKVTSTDHYGFFWGADTDNLGYNNGVTGYKWVYRGNNNRPEFRTIDQNNTFLNMDAVSFAYNDGVWHRWVLEVLPSGVNLYVDGTLIGSIDNAYSVPGYCGLHTYNPNGPMMCRNVSITSLDSKQNEALHYNTHSLAGAADGVYKMVNGAGQVQEVYVSDGWMLVSSNDARSAVFPVGNSRLDLAYTVNRNSVNGHLGEPSPDTDYLIGGFIDHFSFNRIKVIGWGHNSTNSTYNYNNRGSWVSAEWAASSLTTVVPRGNVTIGGTTGIGPSANYFVGDGIRQDYNTGGFSANYNQTTIGGVGVNGSSGDPTTGCYLGHGTDENTNYYEGWYDSGNASRNCQGYTTWVKS